MAVNDHTLNQASRTAYYESPGILLPYSKIVIDGVEYIEPNVHVSKGLPKEGGGTHALPGTGQVAGIEYRPRSAGYRSSGGSSGTTRARPASSPVHNSGWI